MNFDLIKAHTCFLGHTGYANHAREFFTRLNKRIPVRVRNFTHVDDVSYLTDEQKDMIIHQTWGQAPWSIGKPFHADKYEKSLHIVLSSTNHCYFYDEYSGPKIAYNVWESTRQPQAYFDKLLEFDQLWVPTQWQRQCSIEQGYPEERVKVVPEGVDGSIFNVSPSSLKLDEYEDGRFKFLVFGRWEHRKATEEIIRTFLDTFSPDEPVDIVCSVDNQFSVDGLNSTEERLKHYGLEDPRVKIKHFPSFEEYVAYLRTGHVFVSCSRSEGWNLPLIEAIACGIPTICSNYGAQLEFAVGASHLVDIVDHRAPRDVFGQENNTTPGTWSEPDFEHLSKIMRNVYVNYDACRPEAMISSVVVRADFNWEKAADKAIVNIQDLYDNILGLKPIEKGVTDEPKIPTTDSSSAFTINNFIDTREGALLLESKINELITIVKDYEGDRCAADIAMGDIRNVVDPLINDATQINQALFSVSFIDGPKLTINGDDGSFYDVEFIDTAKNDIIHADTIAAHHWTAPNRKYYTDWLIKVKSEGRTVFEHRIDLEGQRVLLNMDAKGLGDNIAWMPSMANFIDKHKCNGIVSTFWNQLFEGQYPDVEFVEPGTVVQDLYASYNIGCWNDDLHKHTVDWRGLPLQKIAADILGVEHIDKPPKINVPARDLSIEGKYVCIGIHSTTQAKYWNNDIDGWQEVVNYLKGIGYKVLLISKEESGYMDNKHPAGIIDKSGNVSIMDRIVQLKNAEFFIGVSSGLSWLAWAIGVPTILISGVTDDWNEFGDNVARVINKDVCHGCFNDPAIAFDKGDWYWCPRQRGTSRMFECSREISSNTVISAVDEIRSRL